MPRHNNRNRNRITKNYNRERGPEPAPLSDLGPLEGPSAQNVQDDQTLRWYWGWDAGGMKMRFGAHKGKVLHDVPLSYLWWCQNGQDWIWPETLSVIKKYEAGLDQWLSEGNFGELLVPVGTTYRGQPIKTCRDKVWMRWLIRNTSAHFQLRHRIFFNAIKAWLQNHRHQEARRDIGERLDTTRYKDDLEPGLEAEWNDTVTDFVVPDSESGDDDGDYKDDEEESSSNEEVESDTDSSNEGCRSDHATDAEGNEVASSDGDEGSELAEEAGKRVIDNDDDEEEAQFTGDEESEDSDATGTDEESASESDSCEDEGPRLRHSARYAAVPADELSDIQHGNTIWGVGSEKKKKGGPKVKPSLRSSSENEKGELPTLDHNETSSGSGDEYPEDVYGGGPNPFLELRGKNRVRVAAASSDSEEEDLAPYALKSPSKRTRQAISDSEDDDGEEAELSIVSPMRKLVCNSPYNKRKKMKRLRRLADED